MSFRDPEFTASGAEARLGGVAVGSPIVKRALQFSLWDAIFFQIMFTLVDTYSIAGALKLKAPAVAISLLSTLPMLIGSFAQAFAVHLVDPSSGRKRYVVWGVRMQCLFLAGAGMCGLLPGHFATWSYVAAIASCGVSGMIFGNFWTTWFYDLVPDKIMGRHTAWRNTILSSLQLTLALATGIFARRYTTDTVPWGFFITILSIAALSRYVSSRMLVMQFEPPRSRPFQPLPLLKFSLPKPLIVYGTGMALFHGAAAMAGPFFSVWYLRDLKFDYLTFTIGSACATIGTVSSLRLWGRLVDGYGPARMLRIAAMLAACAPFPYLVSTTPAAIWAFNFFAGVAWTGINIGGFKYLLRATGTECQEQALSFVNCAQGASMFLFGLLGAYFAANLPAILGYRLRGLFLLSGLLRFAICSFVLVRLRDRGEAPAPGDLLARAGRLLGWRNHSSVGLDSRAREQ